MAETSDYTPAHWAGHDFTSARSAYDATAGRSYGDAKAAKKTASDLVQPELRTNSPSPLIIAADVTGSMGEWPAVMFEKLPYLELEGQTYLGKDMEIAWLAVGDVPADSYPLQSRPFTKGTELKTELAKLVIEKGGGGTMQESYQLAAFYALHKVHMPRAIRPIMIMIGDEKAYPTITVEEARLAGVNIERSVTTRDMFALLRQKMSVYLIRKPYRAGTGDGMSEIDKEIHREWAEYLGEDHIAYLAEPKRVVDVIFGILAKETGRVEEFRKEIEGRQTKAQVDTVYKSLKTVHALPPAGTPDPAAPKRLKAGKSTMHNPGGGKKSGDLL